VVETAGQSYFQQEKSKQSSRKRRQRSVTSAVALRRYFTALAFVVLELAVGALAEPPPPIPPGTEVWAAMSGDAYRA